MDTTNPRLLPFVLASDGMSNEACIAAAELGQYKYAGTEYGRECWMGNDLSGVGTSKGGNGKTDENQCGFVCKGAMGEVCGAANRMNLWVRGSGT